MQLTEPYTTPEKVELPVWDKPGQGFVGMISVVHMKYILAAHMTVFIVHSKKQPTSPGIFDYRQLHSLISWEQ